MSTDVGYAGQTPGTDRQIVLGSFALVRRLPSDLADRPGVLVAEAIGQTGSPHASRGAIARCAPRTLGDPAAEPRILERAQALTKLAHPHLNPVLEAGALSTAVFAVEPHPAGEPLARRMANGAQPPVHVARWAGEIAAALTTVHAAGLAHGRVTPAVIWIDLRERAVLGGLFPPLPVHDSAMPDPWAPPEGEPESAAGDQYQLALTVASLLTGREPSSLTGSTHSELPGVAERIASIVKRGMAPEPEQRFPTIAEFAEALAVAVQQTGDDLVAGVWEALSRGDRAMASLMIDLAERCSPSHADLPVLRMRLNGNLHPGDFRSLIGGEFSHPGAAPGEPQQPAFIALPDPAHRTPLGLDDPTRLLLSPAAHQPRSSRANPWMPLMTAVFGGIIILAILMAVAFAYS